jgi:hypothetical protein
VMVRATIERLLQSCSTFGIGVFHTPCSATIRRIETHPGVNDPIPLIFV